MILSSDEEEENPPPKKKAAVSSRSLAKPRASTSKAKSKQRYDDDDFDMASPEVSEVDDNNFVVDDDEDIKPAKRKAAPKKQAASSSKTAATISTATKEKEAPTKSKYVSLTILVFVLTDSSAGQPRRQLNWPDLWRMAQKRSQTVLLMLWRVSPSSLQGNSPALRVMRPLSWLSVLADGWLVNRPARRTMLC